MNSLQCYVIAVIGVIAAAGFWTLWRATGSVPCGDAPEIPKNDPEPTFKISEKYGCHEVGVISTEYGDSLKMSDKPGIYYQLYRSYDDGEGKRRWMKIRHFLTLSEAEECMATFARYEAEKSKVRPAWQYRKDGTPYP